MVRMGMTFTKTESPWYYALKYIRQILDTLMVIKGSWIDGLAVANQGDYPLNLRLRAAGEQSDNILLLCVNYGRYRDE